MIESFAPLNAGEVRDPLIFELSFCRRESTASLSVSLLLGFVVSFCPCSEKELPTMIVSTKKNEKYVENLFGTKVA
ncbi:hypothetical protein SDC9_109456 [bioreactor metagenome]|uniref:Uncharacterized protein n=1 Tax=bioreactor metagenome TaxID=1076179 RepID=A0A645BD56_9ZZZZ